MLTQISWVSIFISVAGTEDTEKDLFYMERVMH